MKADNYEFRFLDLLLVPYCFAVAFLSYALIGAFLRPFDHLFGLLLYSGFLSAYPIFLRGRSSYWSFIGKWTFAKWLIAVFSVGMLHLVLHYFLGGVVT